VADKVIVDVEINTDVLAKFNELVAKYNALLKQTNGVWNQKKRSVDETADKVSLLNKLTNKISADSQKFYENIAKSASKFVSIGKVFLMAKGAFDLIRGAGNMFGLRTLAKDAADTQRMALGLGLTNVGAMQSFRINFQRLVDAENLQAQAATARYDVTSNQRVGMLALGYRGQAGMQRASEHPEELMKKAFDIAKRTPEEFLGPTIEAYKLPFSLEEMIRLKNTSKADFDDIQQMTEANKSKLNIDQKTLSLWNKLNIQLELTSRIIEVAFIKGLAPLAGPLGKLSDKLSDAAEAVGDWVGDKLKSFMDWVASFSKDDIKKGLDTFVSGVTQFVGAMKTIFDWALALAKMLGYQEPLDPTGSGHTMAMDERLGQGGAAPGGGEAAVGDLGVRGFWTPAKEKEAYDKLVAGGMSPDGAVGLISRWRYVESPGGPTSVNPQSGAYGIAQALGPRKPGFLAAGSDFGKQLDRVVTEAQTSEKAASGDYLHRAKGDEEGAEAASSYERAEGWNKAAHRDYFTTRTKAGMSKVREDLKKLEDDAKKSAPAPAPPDKPKVDAVVKPQAMNKPTGDLTHYQGFHRQMALNIYAKPGSSTIMAAAQLGGAA
jgi:hypothetical protein